MCTIRSSPPLMVGLFTALCSLCPLWLMALASAPLDPELKSQYKIRVVLKVAEHRMLSTPEFQTKIETALRDQLQAGAGQARQDRSHQHSSAPQ